VTTPVSDIDFLRIQTELLSHIDGQGRIVGLRGLRINTAWDGRLIWFGDQVPDQLLDELRRLVEAQPLEADPGTAPRVLGDCRRMLEPVAGPLRISSGPTFLVAPDVGYTTDAEIVRSVEPKKIAPLRDLNPGNWTAEEWPALLAGTLGPWAMAMVDRRVASICHTPRPIGREAAECGTWTAPEYRGRGLAAATTAAWAEILAPRGLHLFYSTDADNHSSRGVAARLGLRLIGWSWELDSPKPDVPKLHPLLYRADG
jgi:GNAT superfamily N-acetyltransferase